jgi:translation elongation factor P/translation initiation factor 5A
MTIKVTTAYVSIEVEDHYVMDEGGYTKHALPTVEQAVKVVVEQAEKLSVEMSKLETL